MRSKLYAAVGAAALVGLGLHVNPVLAGVVFNPLQTNLSALDPMGNSLGSEDITSSEYEQTGSGTGDPNEMSDSGGDAINGDQSVVLHYQATDFPAQSFFDVFVEITVPPGPIGQIDPQIINPTGDSQTISGSGFFLSPTEIPLDSLNENSYPDSMFTPIPGLNESLGSGGTDSATIVLPEPTGIAMLLCGGGLLMKRRGKIR